MVSMRFCRKAAVYFILAWVATWMVSSVTLGMTLAAGPAEGVHYDQKTRSLTLHVQDMPLNEILQTVSAASGFKLSIQADLNRPVTMDFARVPLDQAIRRLVQPNSSAMIYSKTEEGAVVLTSVKIFDKGETQSSPQENLPIPRPPGPRSRSVYGNSDRGVSGFSNDRGGPPNQVGGDRNNRRNRGRRRGADLLDAGSQRGSATGTTGGQ
jgi:hypothetical protein